MSVKTVEVIVCDKCGLESTDENDFRHIKGTIGIGPGTNLFLDKESADYCLTCFLSIVGIGIDKTGRITNLKAKKQTLKSSL